jgi:GAF domain-containing protein
MALLPAYHRVRLHCGAAAFRSLELSFGEGLTGKAAFERRAVSSADAHIDPAAGYVPGTAEIPEGIVCVPLLARERLLGVLTLYRSGEERAFEADEVELVSDFAAIAALALDNARTRSELEHLARTDDLTGVLNRRAFMSQLEHELAVASRYGSPLEAHALAERLSVAIATLPLVQPLRASIGVATLTGNEQDALLEEADRLLYEAKRTQGTPRQRRAERIEAVLPCSAERKFRAG